MNQPTPGVPRTRALASRVLDPRTSEIVSALLDGAEPLIPFAEAILIHLAADPAFDGARDQIIADLALVLRAARDPGEELPVDVLAANPPLLASLFQNTDLLAPSAEETTRIARMVMIALERFEDAAT